MKEKAERRRRGDEKIDTEIQVSRNERRRTIFYSVIAAGLVSLFIGHAFEVEASNNQADRSRKNCTFLNDRVRANAVRDKANSDSVLGNSKAHPPTPPADFSTKPYSAFASFKPLIIAQAKQQRADSQAAFAGLKNCDEVFPKNKTFWILG